MPRRFPGPLRVRIVQVDGAPVKFVTTGPRVPCVIVNEEPALHGRLVGPTDPAIRLEGAYGYFYKVLGYGPLVYFPQWEPTGLVSQELVNGWDGTYQGVTLGQPGIGDGNTCPFFDGINDFDNIFTAALQAAFDGGEGTMMVWARMANVGVWTDGARRRPMCLLVDANNYVFFEKTPGANTLRWEYSAGAVVEQVNLGGLTTVDWIHMAITWSASTPPTGEVRAYYNGAQTGLTQVGLGVWAGNLSATNTAIGVTSTAPLHPFHGWLAHGAVWTRALAPGEIADLAVI